MAKNITLELIANNLGPHETLNTKIRTGSLEIGIYANNGSGKTFLSRAFRLATKEQLQVKDSNRLLTIGKNSGSFKLKITSLKEPGINRDLEFTMNRDNVPIITKNSTDYIFRVFNDDYIRENLEGLKYKPNGQIEGYILGKEKIDLSKEKELLEKTNIALVAKENALKLKVDEATESLSALAIRRNTGEYQNVNYSNLFNPNFNVEEEETFAELVVKHNQLKSLPDNLPDLKNVSYLKKTSTTSAIIEFLKDGFSRSSIAEDFKNKVKNKQGFIEMGLKLMDDKSDCPFCEQTLTENALSLIDKYIEYLSETEAQQIKRANDLYSQLYSERKENSEILKAFETLHLEYLKNQKFIPSHSDKILLELLTLQQLDAAYEIVHNAIERKKGDITLSITDNELIEAVAEIEQWIQDCNLKIQSNGAIIQSFNEKKNNSNGEKLDLNRRLCKARFIELKVAETKSIGNIETLKSEAKLLEEDILRKEQNEKISKKQKVVDTFTQLLCKFFGDKYTFDDTTFCLKFRNHLLESNASDVLSTGEKSIVAFCYYIAETHRYIDKEEDYSKLFFIIDDPISSQDFHFVYATSQIIRTLNKLFDIDRLRLIVLTHNLEFMSIIIRNKIIDQKFIFANNKLDVLGNELIMPYEEHLRDVYEISQGSKTPSHTTANSLRHVLETINRFVAPDVELNSFCEKIDGFAESEFLYSLMHDGSHGGIRLQTAYTEPMIKKACDVVSNYVLKDFGGQIRIISN